MSDRGDVMVTIYCKTDATQGVLTTLDSHIDEISAWSDTLERTDGGSGLTQLRSGWLDVQNNTGNTDGWAKVLVDVAAGVEGFELLNSLSEGVYYWRWTPTLGMREARMDYEDGEFISLSDITAMIERAPDLDAFSAAVDELVGRAWITALDELEAQVGA